MPKHALFNDYMREVGNLPEVTSRLNLEFRQSLALVKKGEVIQVPSFTAW